MEEVCRRPLRQGSLPPPPPAPAPHPRHLQPGTDALRRPPSSTARARHPRHPRLQDGPPARTGCLQARLPAWAGCLPGQAACKGRLPARAGWLQGRAACRDRRRPAHPSTLGARRPRHPRLQDWLAERAACARGTRDIRTGWRTGAAMSVADALLSPPSQNGALERHSFYNDINIHL